MKTVSDQPGSTLFRLVFADIDGTLVDPNGEISLRTQRVLDRIQAAGCRVVLCTGRSRSAARRIADRLGARGCGIVLNGAIVVDWETDRILRRTVLPSATVRAAADIAHGRGMAAIWLGSEETGDHIFAEAGHPLWPEYAQRNHGRLRFATDISALPESPASLAAYGTEEQTIALAGEWRQSLGSEVAAVAGPTAAYHAWYAQLTTAEADKGAAAAFLADYYCVPRAQTLAIGDHRNDVGLLRWAGLGICMGDGDSEARAAADYVTGSLAEDGAAYALEQFVLANE